MPASSTALRENESINYPAASGGEYDPHQRGNLSLTEPFEL